MISHDIHLLNCQTLTSSKYQIIKQFIQQQQPFIVILTETHHTSSSFLHTSVIHHYQTFSFPSHSPHSGGILVFINQNISGSCEVSSSSFSSFNCHPPLHTSSDRKSTRLNSSHLTASRMPSSA